MSSNGDLLLVYWYVDDFIFTGNNPKIFEEFKISILKEFEMTDGGLMPYFHDVVIKQINGGIFISPES